MSVEHRETIVLETTVNGRRWRGEVPVHEVLADLLRERLGLTGTKVSCAAEVCGACTVLIDGLPMSACSVLALEIGGRSVATVEGLAADGRLSPLQEAFVRNVATQCGFCTPGQLMAATALLATHPRPSRADIAEYMRGNTCRCGCYPAIARSIEEASSADTRETRGVQ